MASACGEQSSEESHDQLSECAICMDKFVDPCALTCSHTFCRQCLVRHCECSKWSTTDQGAGDNEVINCPTCRRTCPLPAAVRVDLSPSSVTAECQFNPAGLNEPISHPSSGSLVSTAACKQYFISLLTFLTFAQ